MSHIATLNMSMITRYICTIVCVSWILACTLPLRHIGEYFVKYQNIVLEIQWMVLSMERVSWEIFGDGCVGLNCMDTAATRPST
jgi:hypothetical protein